MTGLEKQLVMDAAVHAIENFPGIDYIRKSGRHDRDGQIFITDKWKKLFSEHLDQLLDKGGD